MREKLSSCDLCGGRELNLYLKDVTTWEHLGKFNLVVCQNCGLVFVSPRPKSDQIQKFYPPERYWGDQDIRKPHGKSLNKKWCRQRDEGYGILYREIFKQFPKPARILDIGCGTGGFLTAFRDKDWQVLGTEISKEAASYSGKTYGFPVKIGDLLEIDFSKEKFDVIVINGVLEHVFSPRETLEKVSQLLSDDGLLAIVVPNIESLGFKIFKGDWWPLQPPRHLYHFSPKTITILLQKTGFKVLSMSHFNFHHNFYSLFESFRFKLSPRFKKASSGGLAKTTAMSYFNPLRYLLKEFGKVFDFAFASTFAILGALFKRGEMLTIYAKKA